MKNNKIYKLKSKFLSDSSDHEIEAKLNWLVSRLPMTREQIVKKAIKNYYEKKSQWYVPNINNFKTKLLSENKNECFYCKKHLTVKDATVDHKIPLGRGGKTEIDNLVPTCEKCNNFKGHMTDVEYNQFTNKMMEVLSKTNLV